MTPLQKQVNAWSEYLNKSFPQRRDAINVALLSYLYPCNGFFLGAPGTAKTMLARSINQMWDGARFLFRQLHPGTVPEQILGPTSMKGLQQDRFEHATAGFLPDCHGLLLDELWRGGRMIFNALLMLINEREFQQGPDVRKMPLLSMIGTSNSVPEPDSEFTALYDRLLLKTQVEYLHSMDDWKRMLGWGRRRDAGYRPPSAPSPIPLSELTGTIHAEIRDMVITEKAQDKLEMVKHKLNLSGIIISDRTWNQFSADTDPFGVVIPSLVKAAAWMHGKTQVDPDDLGDAAYLCLWSYPDDIPAAHRAIAEVLAPLDQVAQRLLNNATEVYRSIKAISPDSPDRIRQLIEVNDKLRPIRQEVENYLDGRDRTVPTYQRMVDAEVRVGQMMGEISSLLGL